MLRLWATIRDAIATEYRRPVHMGHDILLLHLSVLLLKGVDLSANELDLLDVTLDYAQELVNVI